MFGALNRFISRLDAEPQGNNGTLHGAFGFQVLRNTIAENPIEPWFDFIIGINGRSIENPDPNLFATEVRNCAGNSISLGLWNAKGQRIREIFIPVPLDSRSLGLSLQWQPLSSTEDVWHILEVTPNSPADQAGLLPYGDYVIGSPEALMRGESGLGELVEDRLNTPLSLHVYNHEYNVTRTVTITPSRNWGGTGALGCILGFGALHRLPPALDEPPQAPGETLFETARFSNEESRPPLSGERPVSRNQFDSLPNTFNSGTNAGSQNFLVPADVKSSSGGPPTAPSKTGSRKARTRHNIAPTATGSALEEYLAEGEAKSREQEGPSPKPAGNIAPPPMKAALSIDSAAANTDIVIEKAGEGERAGDSVLD